MGVIAAVGFEIIFAVAIGIIATVIGLFFGNIILFESIGIAIGSGFAVHGFLHIHPAFCILIGIAVCALLFWVQHTKFGFWIVSGGLSFLWALIIAAIVYDGTHKDKIWTYVVMGLVFLFMLGLHKHARDNSID